MNNNENTETFTFIDPWTGQTLTPETCSALLREERLARGPQPFDPEVEYDDDVWLDRKGYRREWVRP